MNKYDPNIEFTLLYDGLCPFCRKAVARLFNWDKHGRLRFQDINDAYFDPAHYGKTPAELMADVHGVYPDGRVVKGMDVFRAAHTAVGLGWLVAPTGWPLLKPLFDLLGKGITKYRLRLARLDVSDEPCDCGKE